MTKKLKDEETIETGKEETPQITTKRGCIGFLISDEIEAIDGYDKTLKRADLSEYETQILEKIRNDEIDHIDLLNEIMKTLTTGAIENTNGLAPKDEEIKPADVNEPLADCTEKDCNAKDDLGSFIENVSGKVNSMAHAAEDCNTKVRDRLELPELKDFIAKARSKGVQYVGQEGGKWKFLITEKATLKDLEDLAKEGLKISNTYYQFPHDRYLFIDDCAKRIKDMHYAETDKDGNDWYEFDQGDTLDVEGDELVTRNDEGTELNPDNMEDKYKVNDSDLSLLKEYYNEKQPNKKMELRTKLNQMGYEEGISGVNTRDTMWVKLNGKRYQVKNLSNVTPLDKSSCSSNLKDASIDDIINKIKFLLNKAKENPSDSTLRDFAEEYNQIIRQPRSWIEQNKKQIEEDLTMFKQDLNDCNTNLDDKLVESSSEEAFNKNIATEIKAGKDTKIDGIKDKKFSAKVGDRKFVIIAKDSNEAKMKLKNLLGGK